METLERLQKRLGTLGELQGIVRTMKALSTASIRQYESASESLDHYARNLELGLHAVLRDKPLNPQWKLLAASETRHAHQTTAIIFGTDHGLCGSFNDDIATYALDFLQGCDLTGSPRVLAVGSRVASILQQSDIAIEGDFTVPGSAESITLLVQELLLKIDRWRSVPVPLDLYIFFNRRSGQSRHAGYEQSHRRILPVDLDRFQKLDNSPWPSRHLPTYTMEPKSLISAFLRQYFFVSLFRACAESQASEHTNRLETMQAAEKNLADRLDQVKTQFRRVRQETITTELLDLLSGFETIMNSPQSKS